MKRSLIGIALFSVIALGSLHLLAQNLEKRYNASLSQIVYDRHGEIISVTPNQKGHIVLPADDLPEEFVSFLIAKEDRRFYYHLGTDPVSLMRIVWSQVSTGEAAGGSTIHEQLAKNLLGNENNRTLKNKAVEVLFAISLKLFVSNEDVLQMYANSVYLGNQIQGFETASQAYFGKPLNATSESEQISLLATLSHPSTRNPWADDHVEYARALHEKIGTGEFNEPQRTTGYSFQTDTAFEVETGGIACLKTCSLTIDHQLTEDIRAILKRYTDQESYRGITHGAVVVLHAETSELLALVGSPLPRGETSGAQINMALEPRPIGSTIKPFLYLKGFGDGLRPYSLVDDREYRYPIATGFSLYPKNFDGSYSGVVTLHHALANSLNVPSVKVLEYIALEQFYHFMSERLGFIPLKPFDTYQYGIALGGLEMDLLTLTHYFSVFPQKGMLVPLRVVETEAEQHELPHQSTIAAATRVSSVADTELVHAILSDRQTGVEQFGLSSNLNLTYPEYGVKTGTSRDFHDSWVVGYTNDLVVGVWLGNAENTALESVTGQSGAGAVWHDVMEYLFATEYHTETPFQYTDVTQVQIDNSYEWARAADQIEAHQNLLIEERLIVSIHNGDVFERNSNIRIPLVADAAVIWSANGTEIGNGYEVTFTPPEAGNYEISAYDPVTKTREIISITVTDDTTLR